MSQVVVINDSQFEQAVFQPEKPVLVYFWASWCGPCKLVSPSIDWVAQNYSEKLKVFKLEVDPNPDSVAKCQVEGVPALRLYKGKELVESHEGAIGKQALKAMLDNHLS